MTILESLFRPTEKDQRSGINQRRWYEQLIFSSGLFVIIDAAGQAVPRDTMRVVDGIAILIQPGAAQFARYASAFITRNGSVTEFVGRSSESDTVLKPLFVTWTDLDFPLLLGEFITYRGVFNASAASNSVSAFAWGYEIPRGNYEGN